MKERRATRQGSDKQQATLVMLMRSTEKTKAKGAIVREGKGRRKSATKK